MGNALITAKTAKAAVILMHIYAIALQPQRCRQYAEFPHREQDYMDICTAVVVALGFVVYLPPHP